MSATSGHADPGSLGETSLATLRRRIHELDGILSAQPTMPGISGGSIRAWLEESGNASSWPTVAPSQLHPAFALNEARDHLRMLSTAWWMNRADVAPHDSLREDTRRVVRSFLAAGLITVLNERTPGGDKSPASARFAWNDAEKSRVVRMVLDGWMPAKHARALPPIAELVISDRARLVRDIGSRTFLVELLQFAAAADASHDKVPAIYRETLLDPVIQASDAWLRFLIRFHRAERTLKESLMQMVSRSPSGQRHGARQDFWALRGINLAAYPGDTIGIIGRNGSGKTTFLKALAGILSPDRGSIVVRGKVGCLLSFGVGFNAQLSGRENVYLNGSILGLSERDIASRIDQIVAFSELGEFIDAPVRTYSAGMRGRLGFSIAVHIDPDILVLDEVLTVGDDYFQKKAGSILTRFQQANKTVVIASHSMDLIRRVSTHAVWIEKGQVRMAGDPTDVTRAYVADSRRQRESTVIQERSDEDVAAAINESEAPGPMTESTTPG